jgi:hypothetical protein
MSFEEKGQKLYIQQGPLFGNQLAATIKSPSLLPSRFEVLLSVDTILFKIIVIQCLFCLQGNSFATYHGLHPLVKTDRRVL